MDGSNIIVIILLLVCPVIAGAFLSRWPIGKVPQMLFWATSGIAFIVCTVVLFVTIIGAIIAPITIAAAGFCFFMTFLMAIVPKRTIIRLSTLGRLGLLVAWLALIISLVSQAGINTWTLAWIYVGVVPILMFIFRRSIIPGRGRKRRIRR